MRPSLASLAVLALVVSGCGGGGSDDPAKPAATAKAPAAQAAVPDDVCAVLTSADVSTAVGATLTGSTDPGGGCTYKPDDPRGLRVSVTVLTATGNGGLDGYLSGLGSTFKDGQRTDVPDVGEKAVVEVGETVYGGSHQAGAVALSSGLLITANALGGSDDVLAEAATRTLTIAVEKLG